MGRWRSQDLRETEDAYRKTLVAYVDDSDAVPRVELLHIFDTGQKAGDAKKPEQQAAVAAAPSDGGPMQKLERFVDDKLKRFVDKAEALVDQESSARKAQKRGDGSSPGSLRLVFPDETVWEKAEKIFLESQKRQPMSRRGEWKEVKRLLLSPQRDDDRELAEQYVLDIKKELVREWETKVSEVVESSQANGDLRDFLGSLRRYLPERFNDEEGAYVDAAFQGCLMLRYVPPTRLLAADFVDLVRAYPDEFSGLGLAGAFYVQEECGGGLRERICAVALEKVPACTLRYRCSDGQWSDCVSVRDFASRLGKDLREDVIVQTVGISKPMPFNSCREEFEGFGCPRLWMPEEGVTTPDERCRHVRAIIHSSRTGDLLRAKQRLAWAKACAPESQIILAVDLLLAVGPLIDPVRLVDRRILSELRVDPAAAEWVVPSCSGQRLLHVAARHNRGSLVRGLLDLGHDPAARDHLGHVAAHYGCADELELYQGANLDGQTAAGSSSCSQWSDPVSDPSELTAEDMVSPAVPRDKAARREAFRDALKNCERMTREEFNGETRFVLECKGLIYVTDATRDYLIDIQPTSANRRDIWRKVVSLEKRHRWAREAKARAAKRLAKARAKSAAE
eukprot:SAG22_NODE_360_length_11744_cov_37.781623_4_plen_622_part_00